MTSKTKAGLSPERVIELRDAVLALIDSRGTKECSETKGVRYSDFKVDDLIFQHIDGSYTDY